MDIAKRIVLVILTPLFTFLLFATAFDIGFVRTATHPATVKKLVADSGIYNSVVPSLLQQAKSINTSAGSISTDDPAIKNAANSAISPQFVQENTESAIDSIYAWLNGKIDQPNFKIDLSGPKTSFAESVAAAAQQRLAGLPTCSVSEQLTVFNALDAACLPRGVSATAAASQLKSEVLNGQGFLDQNSLSAADIKNGSGNQSIFSGQLKNAPEQYQRAKKTPLILSLLTILVGAGIVFASKTWQVGLRHVGITMAVIGIIMLIFAWVLNHTVSQTLVPKIKLDNAVLQTDVRNLVTEVARQIDKNYWFFGGLYAVVGAGAIGGAEFHRRKAIPAPAPDSTEAPAKTVAVKKK